MGYGEIVMKTVRRIWWSVVGLWVVVGMVAANLNLSILGAPLIFFAIGWYFLGTFISRIIGSMIVSSFRCKGCGLEIPAVDNWSIGSFTDHRTRHVLLAKNPIDGARVGHVNCPQCSSTIFV